MLVTKVRLQHTVLYLQHAGDYTEAARWIEEARTLDTADRYVNCKCVKYLLRINQVDKAVEMAGLFTRVRWRGEGRAEWRVRWGGVARVEGEVGVGRREGQGKSKEGGWEKRRRGRLEERS